jgi:hypothetical protein
LRAGADIYWRTVSALRINLPHVSGRLSRSAGLIVASAIVVTAAILLFVFRGAATALRAPSLAALPEAWWPLVTITSAALAESILRRSHQLYRRARRGAPPDVSAQWMQCTRLLTLRSRGVGFAGLRWRPTSSNDAA